MTAWEEFIAVFIISIAPVNIAMKTVISPIPTINSTSVVPSSRFSRSRRHSECAWQLPAAHGVTGFDKADAGPIPTALVAVTVKVWVVFLVRSDTLHDRFVVVVQVFPSGAEVTV